MADLELAVRLRADGSGLVGELKLSKQELDRLRRGLKETGAQGRRTATDLDRTGRAAQGAGQQFGGLRTAIAALGLVAAAPMIMLAGDRTWGRRIMSTGLFRTPEELMARAHTHPVHGRPDDRGLLPAAG